MFQNCNNQSSLPIKKRHLALSAPDPWVETKKQKLDPEEDGQVLITDDEENDDTEEYGEEYDEEYDEENAGGESCIAVGNP